MSPFKITTHSGKKFEDTYTHDTRKSVFSFRGVEGYSSYKGVPTRETGHIRIRRRDGVEITKVTVNGLETDDRDIEAHVDGDVCKVNLEIKKRFRRDQKMKITFAFYNRRPSY